MNSPVIVTFIDHIGRTIFGEKISETDTHLEVKNPAIIHVQPTQNGQLNVQTIPLFFKEFVGEKNRTEGTVWKYNKATLVIGMNIENDARLVSQYHTVFAAAPVTIPPTDPKVIKLFDE